MINKILVALDGSDHANHALEFAIDLAKRYHADITLITVIPPILIPEYSYQTVTNEAIITVTQHLEASFTEILSNAVTSAKKHNPHLKISTRLEKGHPDDKIIEIAKIHSYDMIVLGSRGLGYREYPLGSVSARVAEMASCPVLIVK
jgi:nucleotide-binding universal stress UspA family protein